MKTLVPLNNHQYLDQLIDAGADEFYMGFYDNDWYKYFNEYDDINRMSGFKQYANRYNFEEMIEIGKEIKSKGKSFFVTMNANSYSKEQLDYITIHYFPVLKKMKVDGLIVSDPMIVKAATKAGIDVVASTMCAIYNVDIAKYYYSLGMRRMILPRDISLNEIEEITSSLPDCEFEVFFMRNGCVFSDSYCLGMHRQVCGSTCSFVRTSNMEVYSYQRSFEEMQQYDLNNTLYNNTFHNQACGMCALYRLSKMNVSSLKIVGRADQVEQVVEDVKLTKENLELIKKVHNQEEYLQQMKFPNYYHLKCLKGLNCYYPEVRFNEA